MFHLLFLTFYKLLKARFFNLNLFIKTLHILNNHQVKTPTLHLIFFL